MIVSSLITPFSDPRAHELRMLVELVRLSRVSLLYAEPGADKSEVVRSSVLPLLLDAPNSGVRREVAVLFDWWEKLPLAVLNARIDEALARDFGSAAYALGDAPSDSLSRRLALRQQAFDCTFIIILDRFEEYLAAPAGRPDIAQFEAQFIEAVNSSTLRANFLLGLDEAAAPLLARLRERIPELGDTRVRMPNLDTAHAPWTASGPKIVADRLVGSPPPTGVHAAGLATAGEPVGPIRRAAFDRQDDEALPASTDDTPREAGAGAADKQPKSAWLHSSLAVAIGLALLGLILALTPRPAGEPPPAGTPVSPTMASVPSEVTFAPEHQAQHTAPAAPAADEVMASDPPLQEVPVVPDVDAQDAKSMESQTSLAQARTAEESPTAAASGPPLLYIHVRNEAQRTYAANLAEALGRHGIRVSGVRIVRAGPPVSDLRYFRRSDRAEALRINRALDAVGRPAARLTYIRDFEEPVPRRHYEFWLPPPR